MAQPKANADEMTALLDRILESAGFRAIGLIGAVALLLGVLLLAYGLWRAGAMQPWMAGATAVAAIVVLVAQLTHNRVIFAIAFAIYVVALAPLGWRILTESDEDWEPAPASPATTPVGGSTA
jgi:hypothetical protein